MFPVKSSGICENIHDVFNETIGAPNISQMNMIRIQKEIVGVEAIGRILCAAVQGGNQLDAWNLSMSLKFIMLEVNVLMLCSSLALSCVKI